MDRFVVFGNSGSGKSTLAASQAARLGCPHVDLGTVAWEPGCGSPTRRSIEDSNIQLEGYMAANPSWVMEGCYSSLLELLLPCCTELIFLNPGVETCLSHGRARPWEPHNYGTAEEQDAWLEMLLNWVGR